MVPQVSSAFGDITYCHPEWHWVNEGSLKLEFNLWLVLDGHGHVEMKDRTFTLRAGDCFVFRHAQTHRHTAANFAVLRAVVIDKLE